MLALIDKATIYTRAALRGRFTVVARSGLRCRLAHVNQRPAATGAERAELAAMRNLIFEPGFHMPEQCQIDINGVKWNPRAGTFGAFSGPTGAILYRKVDVVRATDG